MHHTGEGLVGVTGFLILIINLFILSLYWLEGVGVKETVMSLVEVVFVADSYSSYG